MEKWPKSATQFWLAYLVLFVVVVVLLTGCAIAPEYAENKVQDAHQKVREQIDSNNKRHAWGLCVANTLGGWQRLPDSWKPPLTNFCEVYYDNPWDAPPGN